MVNKYNLCDKVRTKIHYENDNRKEVDAFIRGIELVDGTDEITQRFSILIRRKHIPQIR